MLFFRKNQIFSVLFVLYFKNTLLCQKEKSSMRISSINISDNKAVIAALQNDELAEETFERFYKYYYKGLCAYAGRMVPLAIAEEIVQTAMMWIWENRATLITELSVKSLLFTIVRNKALHNAAHLKLRERVHHAILTKTESKYDDPDYYMGEELAELFSAALSRLPERYRKSFEMSRIEGKTHMQIAEELGISPQTVNFHISEAMKQLRKDLKDYLPLLLFIMASK